MKKRISFFMLIIFALGMLSGCSLGKEYVIATDNSFSPFCFTDNLGNPVGFDIDLLKLIADEENIKLQIIPTGLVDSLEALEKEDADGVIAAIIPTDEFNQKFDFSLPYYNEYAFAVPKGKNGKLIEKFNEGLQKLKDNGKYDELIELYSLGSENE